MKLILEIDLKDKATYEDAAQAAFDAANRLTGVFADIEIKVNIGDTGEVRSGKTVVGQWKIEASGPLDWRPCSIPGYEQRHNENGHLETRPIQR